METVAITSLAMAEATAEIRHRRADMDHRPAQATVVVRVAEATAAIAGRPAEVAPTVAVTRLIGQALAGRSVEAAATITAATRAAGRGRAARSMGAGLSVEAMVTIISEMAKMAIVVTCSEAQRQGEMPSKEVINRVMPSTSLIRPRYPCRRSSWTSTATESISSP